MKSISLFSGYFFLVIAIIAGVSANIFAKISNGFSELNATTVCLILMFVCMYSISRAMTVIPVGFTYASYGGLTIAAIALFGIIKYNQVPNLFGVIGIALIIVGVVLLNTLGKIK